MPSLDHLIATSRRAVQGRQEIRSLAELARACDDLEPIRPFTESVVGEEISFVLRLEAADRELLHQAVAAEAEGLAAPLAAVAGTGPAALPVLLTDVVVDPYQLYEARIEGADGIILIAEAFHESDDLEQMAETATDLGLDVVVDVGEHEIEQVLELLDPDSFLIRNRSGHGEGEVDFERTFSLLEEVPAGKVVLSQGGVRERDQVVELGRAGVDAVILGPWVADRGVVPTLQVLRGEAR
jgi:hypothetical protein